MPSEDGANKQRNLFKREPKKESIEDEFEGGLEGEGEPEDFEIDIASHGERPSVRAKLSLAAKVGVSTRPRIPPEPSSFYRVYHATSQRMPLEISQLNSAAAYLLICDKDNRVTVWLGSTCTNSDITYAKELALEVYRRDMRNYDATEVETIIWEGEENKESELLKYMLEQCGSDEGTYRGKKTIAERKNEIENHPFSMSIMTKLPNACFDLLEVGYAAPNDFGIISRIPFPPIELDTIIVSNIHNQWDVWVSRGNSPTDELNALKYVSNLAAVCRGVTEDIASKDIRIVRQGCERVTYRRYFKVLTDFEPPGRTVPWQPDNTEKIEGRSLPKGQRSKRFALEDDDNEVYGQPMVDSSYGFIKEILGNGGGSKKNLIKMDSWSYEGHADASSQDGKLDDFIPMPRKLTPENPDEKSENDHNDNGNNNNLNHNNLNDKNRNNNMGHIALKNEDDDISPMNNQNPLKEDPVVQYIPGIDVYGVEEHGVDVDPMTGLEAPLTKLTEGRGFITRQMLKFDEAESISPEQRVQLLLDSSEKQNLLVGWQVCVVSCRINTCLSLSLSLPLLVSLSLHLSAFHFVYLH